MKQFKTSLILIFSLFILQSCIQKSLITIEDDIVYSSKRIKWEYTYREANTRTPLINLIQSIIKEIQSNNEATYTVYDILTFYSESFKLEDKVYLIIDKDIVPMKLEQKEFENTQNTIENSVTNDSTKLTVVTGYSEENRKLTRFKYKFSNEVVEKINKSEQISFRYYSGPNMLTLILKGQNLDKLKIVLKGK